MGNKEHKQEGITETIERIVILYANYSGRDSIHRASFRNEVEKIIRKDRKRFLEKILPREKDVSYEADLIDETRKAIIWHQNAGFNICLSQILVNAEKEGVIIKE